MLGYDSVYSSLLEDVSVYSASTLEKYLSPSDVVLDIGSAQGHLSNYMLDFSSLVYCYDISPSANKRRATLFPQLINIKKLNDIDNPKYSKVNVATLISVIQYMDLKEISNLFYFFKERNIERVILADVDLGVSKFLSALSALKTIFFYRGSVAALNLIVFYFYKAIFRKDFPNSITLKDIEKICFDSGFDMRKVEKNIGACNYRSTFICTLR